MFILQIDSKQFILKIVDQLYIKPYFSY